MEEEKNQNKPTENFIQKVSTFIQKLFSMGKRERNFKENYMDVYKKQSTEKVVRGTQLMLQYVANKGIKLSPTIINTLTFTKEKIELGKKLTSKEEAKFWLAYTDLSNLIQPVTVKSLKCIREEFGVHTGFFHKKQISFAERVQGKYRRTSTFVLVLALATQVLWLWQTYLFSETQTTNKELKQVYEKIIVENKNDHVLHVKALELEGNLAVQKKKLKNLIKPLYFVYNKLQPGLNLTNKIEREYNPENYPEMKKYEKLVEEEYLSNMDSLAFSIQILTLYLLPIFYGLLGSCTYILRVIASEIDKQIYVREHDIQYALRILLGTFAGFVIGWFISSDAEMQVGFSPAKLSPFAIAFVAGYSVELLFTLLDKIVSVYSGSSKERKETETKDE
ncbi:MAG: hypothetical protein H7A25_21310 [Leptospiraceae bacterium]|nr:hypothetical protein [Leptospiraceae bacterium]MCP5502450.1 hypothetical protein [Leptospiraceae bacterium]